MFNPRLSEALKHLDQGFAAFSVWSTEADGTCKCPLGAACTSPGKHPIPQKGFLAASTDPEAVKTMLSAPSQPNLGIVWPLGSEVVVIFDVDGPDWKARLDTLKAKYGPLPPTKTTRTPSGGLHLFYRWPDEVPVPETGHLHGFVVRFPMKGYVVGPGSAIGAREYHSVGPASMAVLPVEWAGTAEGRPSGLVLTVAGGYELPDHVATGARHAEITRMVASLWNKNVSKPMVEAAVRGSLVPLFDEPASDAKVQRDIDEAWDTAVRKWGSPRSGDPTYVPPTSPDDQATPGGGRIEVGLLETNAPKVPEGMRKEAFTTSTQIAGLLDHFTPRTDASFEGLTITSLVYLGALMGRTPTCFYGSRDQHCAFFAMLVGSTGISRKGTTLSLVRGALGQVTQATRGLKQSPNSGEGLIALAAKANGEPILIEEEEFDRVMISKARDGSTLSSILRQAFDDIPLSSATASKIVRSDFHHIAFIGNVTREDVVAKMEQVDLKNGFANRLLWTSVFPRPATVTIHDNAIPFALRDLLHDVIEWTDKLVKPLIGGSTHQFTADARDALADAATRYNAGVGLAPFLSRRLDTIAARISMIYACLDMERTISIDHVGAALAVTDYALASAKWVFPETTGDQEADFVLRHLRAAPGGFLNGAELEALVGRKSRDKQRVYDSLALMGYARLAERPRRDGKAGRPQRGLELT